jgi:hypothetical protein
MDGLGEIYYLKINFMPINEIGFQSKSGNMTALLRDDAASGTSALSFLQVKHLRGC